MHLDGWTLLLQVVNFLVLAWLLRHFLYRPVLAVIAERQKATERVRADAEALRRDAGALKDGLASERAAIAAERDHLLSAAREQAEAERAALLDRARADADRLQAATRAALEEERRKALEDLRERAVTLATTLAARLLREAAGADGALTRPFLEAVCREVEGLPEARRRALAGDAEPVPVILSAAAPLPAGAAADCRDRLSAALGRAVTLTITEDPSLIAGLELRFPHSVLRHSWKQALADANTELTRGELSRDDHAQPVA